MTITYPSEMLPSGNGDLDEIDIIVDGKVYRWRDGQWLTDNGEGLSLDREGVSGTA